MRGLCGCSTGPRTTHALRGGPSAAARPPPLTRSLKGCTLHSPLARTYTRPHPKLHPALLPGRSLLTHPLPCPRAPRLHQGSVPLCLGNLTSLEDLQLSGNHLRGPVPESLCQIGPSLIYLLLFDNELTGA